MTRMLERRGRAQEQVNGPNGVVLCFLWFARGILKATKSHEGEKQLTEAGQGHFDI